MCENSLLFYGMSVVRRPHSQVAHSGSTQSLLRHLVNNTGRFLIKKGSNAVWNKLSSASSGTRKHNKFEGSKRQARASRQLSAAINPASNIKARAAVSKRKKVNREGRSRKKVKVSKSFRKKVKKVIESREQYGWFQERDSFSGNPIPPLDEAQQVFNVGTWNSDGAPTFFDPISVLNAASILFNIKGPLVPDKTITDAGNFQNETLRVRVIDSNVTYRFKNNTARQILLKLWDYSPKTIGKSNQNVLNEWNSALVMMAPSGAPGTTGTLTNLNPLSVTFQTIGASPKHCPSLMHQYSWDETIVNIEPGKEFTHTLKGPKDKMYEFAKFYVNGVFQNQQKIVKGTLAAFWTDLTSTITGGVGRWTDMTGGVGTGLLCEVTAFYKIAMPEQAGFTIPTPAIGPGRAQQLTRRVHRVFAIKHWVNAQPASAVMEVEDENPSTNPTTGV